MTRSSPNTNPTAGAGDPFWYEWAVGLVYVLDLLDPDSTVLSVNFQASGEKGLDDVVVTTAEGTVVALQVKHTRSGDTLSFSDLISVSKGKKRSLMASLAWAWAAEKSGADIQPVLYTNRPLGTRRASSKPKSGDPVQRPALAKFWPVLKAQAAEAKHLDEIRFENSWTPAWEELREQLSELPDDSVRLQFLQALDIRAAQPSLDDLERQIGDRLVELFGVEVGTSERLVRDLFYALRHWTLAYSDAVTRETVYAALAVGEDQNIRQHQLAPPTPFFSSREDLVARVEASLKTGAPVIFVTGPPGSGKTSLVSQLANRRDTRIQLRFHAFRPIDPDNPVLPTDADQGTSAEALWFDLLAQLRDRLRGNLATYQVPVRSDYLTAGSARAHVLRIAAEWAKATDTRIAIAIDGIDHAARAAVPGAQKLLASLVHPDDVPSGLSFIIAGQDPEAYDDYPMWLSLSSQVVRHDLPALRDEDVVALLQQISLPYDHVEHSVARVINEHARGNTLSVLFSVHEAALCASAEELDERLRSREMTPALDSYYAQIWTNAVDKLPAFAGVQIAGVLCYLRGRVDAALLAAAFQDTSEGQWSMCLASLRPLIVRDEGDGYRVLHNDVAVYLRRLLRTRQDQLAHVAGQLADYLAEEKKHRGVFHASIFELLRLAGRTEQHSRIFTPSFVREAWELNRPYAEMTAQAHHAVESALATREWGRLHQVSCAIQDATRIHSCASFHDLEWPRLEPGPLQTTLVTSELFVPPHSSWNESMLSGVCRDLRRLASAGLLARAKSVVARWFQGLTALDVLVWRQKRDELDQSNDSLGELGECLAMVGSIDVVSPTSPNSQVEDAALARRADARLVAGMMRHAARHATLVGWCRVLHRAQTFASDDLIDTLYLLISRRAWGHVHAALRYLNTKLSDRSPSVVATAIGLGTRVPVVEQWAETLGSEIQALAYGAREVFNLEWKTERLAALAFVWAWVDRAKVPQNLASELGALAQLDRDRFNPSAPGLVRCAAVLGHVWSKIASMGIEKARNVVDIASLRNVLRTLLSSADDQDTYNHYDVTCALLEATMAVSSELGGDADDAVGEALSECAQQALGGAIGEAAWRHLLRRGAPHRLLADWCEMWIGEHGYAWQRRAHDRMKEARRFVALASLLGEHGLVIRARNSMLLGVSSFQFRKDDLLGHALAWMQLALEQGADWAPPHAAQLLGLSRAADAVGEDTLGLEVESTVHRCFAGSGPQALLGLWKASPVGTWLVPETTDLFFGLVEAAQKDELDQNAIRSIWCLAVGSLPMQRARMPS